MTEPPASFSRLADQLVCVTGGAGFIGSHLVDMLVQLGAKVRVIDDLSNGRRDNLADSNSSIELIEASILDADSLAAAVAECSVVFHQAALGSVPQSVVEPVPYHEVNSTGTLHVLEAARQAGVGRVVYASSSSAYGESEQLPKVESMRPMPVSPYAASKLMGEHWCRAYSHCYGMGTVSLRYFNVFGPRQRPDSQYAAVVPAFAEHLAHGQTPVVYGDGGQSRDFTYIANVVHANLLAATTDTPLSGEAVNVACGERYTLLNLLERLAEHLNVRAAATHREPRAGDVRHSQADISLARTLLGYETIVEFDEGLRATVATFVA